MTRKKAMIYIKCCCPPYTQQKKEMKDLNSLGIIQKRTVFFKLHLFCQVDYVVSEHFSLCCSV